MEFIVNFLSKIKHWADNHRSAVDYTIGGGLPLVHGIGHYWDHFWSEDNITKLLDGSFGALCYTLIGLIVTFLWHRIIGRRKEKDQPKNSTDHENK